MKKINTSKADNKEIFKHKIYWIQLKMLTEIKLRC